MAERHTAPISRSLISGTRLQDCSLEVVDGPDKGLSVKVGMGRITIGADPRCDLKLSDPTVSGVHAEANPMPNGIQIRDMGSTNGIKFLGNRITDAVLQPGSVVVMGKTAIGLIPPKPRGIEPIEGTSYGSLIGHSEKIRRVFALLTRLEQTDVTVLIEGETGTGKTLVAETIHERSGRQGALVPFGCGAVSPQLIQSELFGHRRGSFTGADEDRTGAIESAAGGTLLLDDISDLPLDLQPTLLRFLETREIQPVGAPKPRSVDVRVIATTNQDLQLAVEKGRFRSDLFYRISVGRVQIPPLRERPEDILPLADSFMRQLGTEAKPLSPGLAALLQSYPWPGNIRQLRNAILRMSTLGAPFADTPIDEDADFHTAKAKLLERFERSYLEQLLSHHRGNLSAASRASGLVRHHLRALLKKHDIDASQYRD